MPVNNRRRSEPTQRKNSTSNSGKQRRESAAKEVPAQSTSRQNNRQAMRKKQSEKRPPARRKVKLAFVNVKKLVSVARMFQIYSKSYKLSMMVRFLLNYFLSSKDLKNVLAKFCPVSFFPRQ